MGAGARNSGSPSSPTGDGSDARTNGTQRAFTEAQLKSALKLVWDSGGDPTILLTSANNREGILNFADGSTNASFRYDHDNTRFEMMCHNGSTVDHTFMEESVHLGVNDADFRLVLSSKSGQYSSGTSNAHHNLRAHGTGVILNSATVTDVTSFEFGGNPRYAMNTGSFYPTADDSYDLGSTSKQWRNIYTADFHLNNTRKEEGNDVDGTKGSWTIQEGREDLYLLNNETGKKFKFKLEEVK